MLIRKRRDWERPVGDTHQRLSNEEITQNFLTFLQKTRLKPKPRKIKVIYALIVGQTFSCPSSVAALLHFWMVLVMSVYSG